MSDRKDNTTGMLGQLDTILNELPYRLFVKDTASVYLGCNTAYAADLGRAPEDLVGLSDFDLFPAALAERYRADDQRVMAGKQAITIEEPYVSNGVQLWLRTTKKPLFDADGEVTGVLGIFENITQERRAREALRRRGWALEALNRAQHAMVHAANERELLQGVCEALTLGDEYPLCWIGWAEADSSHAVTIAAVAGTASTYADGLEISWGKGPFAQGPTGTCIREGRSIISTHDETDERLSPWRERARAYDIRASVSVPLRTPETVLGAMVVYGRTEDSFGPAEIALFEDFAATLLFGIQSRRTRAAYDTAVQEKLEQEAQMKGALEAIMAGASVGLITASAHGTIQFVNPAAEEMFGYGEGELVGRDLTVLMPVGERPFHTDHLARFRETGAISQFTRRPREFTALRQSGERFPIELAVSSVSLNGTTVLIGSVNDVSERKIAERAAREADRLLQQISETIDEVFWVANPREGRLTYASSAFERVIGLSPDFMKRDMYALEALILEEDREQVSRTVREAFATGEPYFNEYRIRRPDGGLRWIWGRGFPVFDDDGAVTSFIGVAQDVTERKEAEAKFVQAQKLESLGHLAGGIAHDFNNLLMAVQIGAQFAKDAGAADSRHLDIILEAADRGADLVRRLSTFSRHQEPRSRISDPRELIRQSLKLIRTALPESIAVEARLGEAVSPASLDPALLESALLNLAINARDAITGAGTLVVAARNVRRHRPDRPRKLHDLVEISVTDTGIGMDGVTVQRALEPFFTTKEAGKGTGLGLSMVHGFVTQSGGFLEIDSAPGQGTTIRLCFPAMTGAPPASRRREGLAPRSLALGTVLLVDDDDSVRKALASILRPVCSELLVAGNGPEALELVGPLRHLDLLISDIVMPSGMTGYQLADLLVLRHPTCRVLLMSGYSADARLQYSSLRDFRLLQKPFSPQTLFTELEKMTGSD